MHHNAPRLAGFAKELTCRQGLDDSSAVIEIYSSHKSTSIPASGKKHDALKLLKLNGAPFGPGDLKEFPQVKLAIEVKGQGTALDLLHVMQQGSTDLSDVVSHSNMAGTDSLKVRQVATNIARCLQIMHHEGVIHGDVKPRNFVMVQDGNYAAIDLDAAALLGKEKVGQKQTSSGCLPPEQARIEQYRRVHGNTAGGPESVMAEKSYDMW